MVKILYISNKSVVRIGLGFLVVLLILASTSVYVASFAQTNRINLSNDTYQATDPNIQNVGNNVYVSWSERSHGIWFRSSTDGGATWSATTRLSTTGGTTDFPLMVATGSYVYVIWSQTVSKVSQIFFAVSSNNGQTFSAAKIIDGSSTLSSITPVIAAYGSDVYVAYDGGGSSYVTSSTNNGATFNTPLKYSSAPEPQLAASGSNAYAVSDRTVIAVSHNNGNTWSILAPLGGSEAWVSASGTNVIISWETKGAASQVYTVTSTNSGTTFSKKVLLSSSTPDAWAPMTGISGNTEYVAYRTFPGAVTSQEYVTVSTNSGNTWSTPATIGISGHDNSWPVNVAVSGSTAFILWYEKTGTSTTSTWQALISESTNSGTTWSTPSVLGGSLPESDVATASVASFGNTAFAVWTNVSSSANTQVYFSSGS